MPNSGAIKRELISTSFGVEVTRRWISLLTTVETFLVQLLFKKLSTGSFQKIRMSSEDKYKLMLYVHPGLDIKV